MIPSIYTGIAGMKTFQKALSVSSNNIANSQTAGYKAQKAVFKDLFYQTSLGTRATENYAGTNAVSIGNGVRLAGVASDLTQGMINVTNGKTDVAIEGDGYFVLGNRDASAMEYTRQGDFQLSEEQFLISSDGKYVMGWTIDPVTKEIDTTQPARPIYIPLESAIQGVKTTEATFSGNIDYDMEVNGSTKMQFPVYDSLGKKINVEMEMVKKADGSFEFVVIPNESFVESDNIKAVYFNTKNAYPDLIKGEYTILTEPGSAAGKSKITVTDSEGTVLVNGQEIDDVSQSVALISTSGASNGKEIMTIDFKALAGGPGSESKITVGEIGNIKFNTVGNFESMTPKRPAGAETPDATLDFIAASSGLNVAAALNFTNITSYATDTSLTITGVNGNSASSVRDYSITDGGIIQVTTDDGSMLEVGKIAVATFANPQGLIRTGNGNYIESGSSGMPRISESGVGNAGLIKANSLENSNVDLSKELVDLMIFQKSFQANTKIIQISDDVTSGIINLIN